MTPREFATKEQGLDENTATAVENEIREGKKKSEFVDDDTFEDLKKFHAHAITREMAKDYDTQLAKNSEVLKKVRWSSATRYNEIQKTIKNNIEQNPNLTPDMQKELINAKFRPDEDEISYTKAYNDGEDVEPRLAGQSIFYAVQNDIKTANYTPEQYFVRLQNAGL